MAYDNFEAFLDAPAKGGKQYEAPLVDLTEMPGLYDNANDPKRIPMTAGDVVWDTVGSVSKAGLQAIGTIRRKLQAWPIGRRCHFRAG